MYAVIIFLVIPAILLTLELFTLLVTLFSYRFSRWFFGRKFNRIARFLWVAISFILRIELHCPRRIDGLPARFLLISNHQSYLDILVLISMFPNHNIRFVAKMELRYWAPCVTTYIILLRHALIHRNLTKAHLQENKDTLTRFVWRSKREPFSIMVFPEGSRASDGIMRRFRSGAVREMLERDPDLPVVSVALEGGHKVAKVFHTTREKAKKHYWVETMSVYRERWDSREKIQQLITTVEKEIFSKVEELKALNP